MIIASAKAPPPPPPRCTCNIVWDFRIEMKTPEKQHVSDIFRVQVATPEAQVASDIRLVLEYTIS